MATKKKKKPASPAAAPAAPVAPTAPHTPVHATAHVRAPLAAPAALGAALRPVVVDGTLLRRIAGWGLLAALLVSVREVWVTLLFVGVVAFLGDPLVVRLERRGVTRALGAAMVIGGGVLLGAALLALVLPSLIGDLLALAQKIPALLERAAAVLEARFGVVVPTRVKDFSAEATAELLELVRPLATGGAVAKTVTTGVGILQGAASALGTLAKAALVPVLGYFVLAELPATLRVLSSFVPPSARPWLDFYKPRAATVLSRLVRGQIVVAGLMSVLYLVGLAIAGVPLALAIAILSGAAYLIPFASGAVCFVLAASLSLLELGGGAATAVIGALITCVVVQLIESYVLTPRIVGEQAGLSPLAALLAVLCGGAAAGFLGVLFALPVASVVALVLREEAQRRAGQVHSEPA